MIATNNTRARPDPFDTRQGRQNSMYATAVDGQCIDLRTNKPVSARAEQAHDAFVAAVRKQSFSCLGAKAAVNTGAYRFGLYRALDTQAATAGLALDLSTFLREQPSIDGEFSTFVASFEGPQPGGEQHFETLVWRQLQRLHDLDSAFHAWDPSTSADPQAPTFGFSFGGAAFFIVGLWAGSGRWSRRFTWPTLVFNTHQQFEELRRRGQYNRLRDTIRERERSGQGSVYGMLADWGTASEARSYAGREVEDGWACPFHAHQAQENKQQ